MSLILTAILKISPVLVVAFAGIVFVLMNEVGDTFFLSLLKYFPQINIIVSQQRPVSFLLHGDTLIFYIYFFDSNMRSHELHFEFECIFLVLL